MNNADHERDLRVKFWFEQGLELEHIRLPTFIDGVVAVDGEAVAAAVSELIHAVSSGEPSPLDRDMGQVMDEALEMLSQDVPKQFDGFEIIEKIGQGGMSTVYRGRQLDSLNREVALKIISAEVLSEDILARFKQEAGLWGDMQHDHIAKLYRADVIQGTTHAYVAMELVPDARPIDVYCDHFKLSLKQRLELFKSLCEAVFHAHRKGVIHRDIKPANVLVGQVDGQGVLKLIDFSIASPVEHLAHGTDYFAGTPNYAAPEVFVVGTPLDVLSDIYGLGAVLFLLLSGSPPYKGRSMTQIRAIHEGDPRGELSLLQSFQAAGNQVEIAASRRLSPRLLKRELKGDLALIVAKATALDPVARYTSALDLRNDLQAFLGQRPIQQHQASPLRRLWKLVRRHPMASTLVMLLLCAMGWNAAQTYQATQLQIKNAERQERSQRFLEKMVNARSPFRSGFNADPDKVLIYVRDQADYWFQDDPELHAQVLCALAVNQYWEERFDISRDLFADALELVAPPHVTAFQAYGGLGRISILTGDPQTAEHYYRERLRLFPDAEMNAEALLDLAAFLEATHRYQNAHLTYQSADAALSQIYEPGHLSRLRSAIGLANCAVILERFEEAADVYDYVLNVLKIRHSENHLYSQICLQNLASIDLIDRNFSSALARVNQVLSSYKVTLPTDHADVLDALDLKVRALLGLNRLEEADALAAEVKTRFSNTTDPLKRAKCNGLLATVSRKRGRKVQAMISYRRALSEYTEAGRRLDPEALRAAHNLGDLLIETGDADAALPILRETLACRRDLFGNRHKATLRTQITLAQALLELKQPEALDHARYCWETALFYQEQGLIPLFSQIYAETLIQAGRIPEAQVVLGIGWDGLGTTPWLQNLLESTLKKLSSTQ